MLSDSKLSPSEIEGRLERILLTVQKPGRYVGGELNITIKEWDSVKIHVAFVFPDIYDLGISNLGIKILYDEVNQRTDSLAERGYSPWLDMEAVMREKDIPLYSLESKHALADFDILGITLPYETVYTNALNVLDLAGIPLRTKDRSRDHPLVIAGGHACFNPEPMHAFIDAFVIGEGEEIIHDIINLYQSWKDKNSPRNELLESLSKIPGLYVPSLYEHSYHEDGTISKITSLAKTVKTPILKRIVGKLPPPPTSFIVPNIEVVHDRFSVEIMRGCTRGCRFCHAGMISRPIRERSVEEIVNAAEEVIRATGFQQFSLMSLSSSDYTHILELVTALNSRFGDDHVTISLPSLRIDTVSVELMDRLGSRKGTGFTLAPEAATERMRRIINKFIPDEQIIETAKAAFERGWTTIKLYFMIGHPSENIEDVKAIAKLCNHILTEGRQIAGGRAKLNVSVGTFVPKPMTPFQWVACDTPEMIESKQDILRHKLRDRNIKLTWTAIEDTLLEAWLTRGDRRLAEVIHTAWKNGAKFDAWQEQHRYSIWMDAFSSNGLDPDFYTHRERKVDEIFPWDNLSAGVRKAYLFQEFKSSLEGIIRIDCREQCFACGILPTFADLRRDNPGDVWGCPEVKSPKRNKEELSA
jgi:radical SAM family uncharacterized protein